MADPALAAVRTIHFASALLLFGQFVYLFAVSPGRALAPGFYRAVTSFLALALVSALAWIALEVPAMSGLAFRQAFTGPTISAVLTQTLFGKMALFRLALVASLFVLLAASRRAGRGNRLAWAGLLAAVLLATIAASGHAAAGRGLARAAHLSIDSVHLLAAGAWLGALLPLVLALRQAPHSDREWARAIARFSTLGLVCIPVLLFSGVLNAAYTVRPVATVFYSQYGRLLLMKIVLFAVIVAFAAINRMVLLPRAEAGADEQPREALLALR